MKIGIALGLRYSKVGQCYYASEPFSEDLWEEPLEVFDEAALAVRCVPRKNFLKSETEVSHPRLDIFEFPNSHGIPGAIKSFLKIFCASGKIAKRADLWHMHSPNIVSISLWPWLMIHRIPYSVELRGDQSINASYLKLRGVKMPRLFAFLMKTILKLHVKNAVAVSSVAAFLIELTPPHKNCPVLVSSDVRIPSASFREPRKYYDDGRCRVLVASGRLEAQKNPLGLLRALAELDRKKFTNWKLLWLGDGPLRADTKKLAGELGISNKVELAGQIAWSRIFEIMDSADLFVLNSVTEGLSRSIVEALACALPVIGTKCGAWQDVLEEQDVVDPMDDNALAQKLFDVLTDNRRLSEMSQRNRRKAETFSKEILKGKKITFHKEVRLIVEQGLKKNICRP